MSAQPETPLPQTLFDDLRTLLGQHAGGTIGLETLLNSLGQRGFGFVYAIFGMLAAVLPTGLCSLMALPIMLFALQQVFGYAKPRIPTRFSGKPLPADTLLNGLIRQERWFRRIERIAKPRYLPLVGIYAGRVAALVCALLAFVILVPGPFTNVPPGIAIALFGFAMIERDGLLMLLAFIGGIIGFLVGLSAVIASVLLITHWLKHSAILPSF